MGMVEEIIEQLEQSYDLMYVDYRDEVPDDFYREVLAARYDATGMVLDEVERWYDRNESAWHVVQETARAAGHNLSSPFVSIEPDEMWAMVDQVLERDESDPWAVVLELTRRDTVLLSVAVSDEWYGYDADAAKVAGEFGASSDESWVGPVVAQGEGVPTVLVAVPGDEFMRFMYGLEFEQANREGLKVRLGYQDAGLLNRLSGSGWIEDLPEQRTIEMPIEDFFARASVDNDPRARTSWSAITGGARASSEGFLELVRSDGRVRVGAELVEPAVSV
jgi:hypothetical protein